MNKADERPLKESIELICEILLTVNNENGEQSKTIRDTWEYIHKRKIL